MLTRLFVLFSVVSLLHGYRINFSNDENLKRNGNNARIYGGDSIPIESAPYQVSLQTRKHSYHFCGGSIYSTNIIVTAAHCLAGLRPYNILVRVGSKHIHIGGSLIGVSKLIKHEHHSENVMSNDVGLLLLNTPLKLGNDIKTIPLAVSVPEDGATSTVSGWGKTERENSPNHLKSVDVEIVSRELCTHAYSKFNKIRDEMICAAAANKDSCQGDSGGPLAHNGELVGIVSWGFECAHPEYPGVYANVAALRTWIVDAATKLTKSTKSGSK